MAAKTFSTMQTNIGNMVRDTSSDFAALIGVWINDAYQDAWRRALWTDVVDENFTFTSTTPTSDITWTSISASDFGEELGLWDITNGHELKRWLIKDWWQERGVDYSSGALDTGNPQRYVMLPEASSIRLDPPPNTSAETYAMPYKKTVTDLSSTDTPAILSLSQYLEFYATGMAYANKRQFQKGDWFLNRAEMILQKLIKEEYTKINQQYQKKLKEWRLKGLTYLTGEKSYDSI